MSCRRNAVLLMLLAAACATPPAAGPDADTAADPAPPPLPAREFRAAWVATVANIDWPSRPGLAVEEQQSEARAILDRLVELNMNAVVFQVRPHGDALYDSALEPWSAYLTGAQGRPPEPFYDPLAFWIEEAHARGLQLHAWFNPYRANHPANPGELSERSIVRAQPELVVRLGDDGYYWMDPALSEVQDRTTAVVLDVVQRYDVDGIHLDDYFYPYPSYNDGQDFPDEASFRAYRDAGGELSRGDWRRHAVDTLIERLHAEIRRARPHVEFGISPFGIWRPGHPSSIRGLDQYDVLYADARRWLNEGWVDYFTPQLYWPIAQQAQSFPVLLGWWSRENHAARHLWPGTSIARARGEEGATEIVNQVMITRAMLPAAPGLCLFSMKWLQRADHEVAARLLAGPYAEPALIPATPWLDDERPAAPAVSFDAGTSTLSWLPRGDEAAFLWLVQVERDGRWSTRILPGTARRLVCVGETPARVAVSAIDRSRNQSGATVVEVSAGS